MIVSFERELIKESLADRASKMPLTFAAVAARIDLPFYLALERLSCPLERRGARALAVTTLAVHAPNLKVLF